MGKHLRLITRPLLKEIYIKKSFAKKTWKLIFQLFFSPVNTVLLANVAGGYSKVWVTAGDNRLHKYRFWFLGVGLWRQSSKPIASSIWSQQNKQKLIYFEDTRCITAQEVKQFQKDDYFYQWKCCITVCEEN